MRRAAFKSFHSAVFHRKECKFTAALQPKSLFSIKNGLPLSRVKYLSGLIYELVQEFKQTNNKTITMKDNADSRLSRWISAISHVLMQETISSPIFLWLTATASKDKCTNVLLSCGGRVERFVANDTEQETVQSGGFFQRLSCFHLLLKKETTNTFNMFWL